MKSVSIALLNLAAAAALTTGFGIGQAAEPLKATIPFDFTVGKTKMPAGDFSAADLQSALARPSELAATPCKPIRYGRP